MFWKIVKYGFYYKFGKKWNWPNLATLTYHKGDVGVEDLNEGVIEAEDDINPEVGQWPPITSDYSCNEVRDHQEKKKIEEEDY